ncbi:MAG TPA: RNA polymerase sigma factor [Gemmatimonadales bacterium]|nr:RNA polymerase sigma factor [Gemmatimonadales bacterium]
MSRIDRALLPGPTRHLQDGCRERPGLLASRGMRVTQGDRVERTAEPSDGAVVRAVLTGDVEQYSVLVRRYRDRYARYASRMLGSLDAAEDAVQDALIRAFDQLKQCRDPDNFAGWFFLILRNRCFAERRRHKRVDGLEHAEELAVPDVSLASLERAEQARSLERALLQLTPEQREVFVLKHVEELSYDEISARVGTGVAALKMRMHRAYDRLRELLRETR